jgi:glycosyltransferase involved in cell wall biosynthesis
MLGTTPNGQSSHPPEERLPPVSIVVPCFRESAWIGRLLDAIRSQTYPIPLIEVVVADGMSDDGTREILRDYVRSHPEFRLVVVDNPQRAIPCALNKAISASTGEILLRMDGHSSPSVDYVATCVSLLEAGKGDMVGGRWAVKPSRNGWAARSIAAAAAHPAAVGDAYYRFATEAREVDTLAFWAFRRRWIETIGLFDEGLGSNEDYDFNSRFRAAGGKIWLDPSISCEYYARPTYSSLAIQYLRYGFWKARMAVVRPSTIRWRQFLPPTALVVFAAVAVMAAVGLFPVFLPLVFAAIYLAVVGNASVGVALRRRDPSLVVGMSLAVATMHLCWASAFLWSLVTLPFSGRGARRS